MEGGQMGNESSSPPRTGPGCGRALKIMSFVAEFRTGEPPSGEKPETSKTRVRLTLEKGGKGLRERRGGGEERPGRPQGWRRRGGRRNGASQREAGRRRQGHSGAVDGGRVCTGPGRTQEVCAKSGRGSGGPGVGGLPGAGGGQVDCGGRTDGGPGAGAGAGPGPGPGRPARVWSAPRSSGLRERAGRARPPAHSEAVLTSHWLPPLAGRGPAARKKV